MTSGGKLEQSCRNTRNHKNSEADKQKRERDSIARAVFDPERIQDCNVKANVRVGSEFLFYEPIPCSRNGYGCLHVIKASLWWQQREFPVKCMDIEGILDVYRKKVRMVD